MIAASGRAMLNAGCVFAVAFWICVLVRSGDRGRAPEPLRPQLWIAVPIAIAISFAAFWQTLWNPFQFDAFTHLFAVRNASWPQMLARFTRWSGETLFFRPVGWLAYWLDARGSGADLLRWHLVNVALHALNGLLVYVLLLRLEVRRSLSAFGAVAFLTSGVTAEAVAWIDAPFDLLATLFVLLAMVEMLRWARSGLTMHLLICSVLTAIACCTKESAFCAPLLAGALGVSRTAAERRRVWVAVASMAACSCAVFVYRWWALGGIGGYSSSGFHWFQVPQLLLFRMWGVLQFPINWTAQMNVSALVVDCSALLYLAVCGRARTRMVLSGLLWSIAAMLPALLVALISSDLAGARVYYLASVGTAVVLANAVEGLDRGAMQAAVAIVIVGFNVLELEHDLEPWWRVSREAAAACRAFGEEMRLNAGDVEVLDLPSKHDGVYFLSNGFPECVAFYSGVDPRRIAAGASQTWHWNDLQKRFERLR